MAGKSYVSFGLLLVCLGGCSRARSDAAKAPANNQGPVAVAQDKARATAPAGPAWDALGRLPLLKGKIKIAVFDGSTIHDNHHRCRGTLCGNCLVNIWDQMRSLDLGIPLASLRRIIYVESEGQMGDPACLCQTTLSGDEVSTRMKAKNLPEGGWHGARVWPATADQVVNSNVAFVDGWLVLRLPANNDRERVFEHILKVHAAEEPSLREFPGMAELIAAGPKEGPVEIYYGGEDGPAPVPQARVEWADAAFTRGVSTCLYATEKDARAALDQVKAMFAKALPAIRAMQPGQPAPEIRSEVRGKVVRLTMPRIRNPRSLQSGTEFDLMVLASDLRRFHSQTGRYPTTEEGLALVAKTTPGGPVSSFPPYLHNYLGEVPLDVWGHPFIYQYPQPKKPGEFDLRSAGPDGQKDTADDIFPKD
jgi:type II secretion system protein G